MRFLANIPLPQAPIEWEVPTLRAALEAKDGPTIAALKALRKRNEARRPDDPARESETLPEGRVIQDPDADVQCVCGRREWPGVMEDVRNLPEEVRGRVRRYPELSSPEYVCPGCREILIREGLTDYYTLAAAQGAPLEWLNWLETKLSRRPDGLGVPAFIKQRVDQLVALDTQYAEGAVQLDLLE